ERGEIFFFYRPKVNREEAHGAEDVQRLYLVLRPESGETPVEEKQNPKSGKEGLANNEGCEEGRPEGGGGHGSQEVNIERQPLLRLIVMGRKSLPENHEKKKKKSSSPYWGFVELVTTKIEHIKNALKGEEYETATRGHRHLPDSRAAGEGIYRILRHKPKNGSQKMHTHLIYKLEYPEKEGGEPQEALNIAREASFIIQIKNPEASGGSRSSGFSGLSEKRKAAFPARLQGILGHGKRFSPADPPDFLNYEGCEILLISASDDIEEELGLELKPDSQEGEARECSDLLETFGEIAPNSTRPLFEGTWL
ncbi:Unknown protein, partial [Striga hermonthica]